MRGRGAWAAAKQAQGAQIQERFYYAPRAKLELLFVISKPLSFIWWGETKPTLEIGLVT
jgi:hypothetical protein